VRISSFLPLVFVVMTVCVCDSTTFGASTSGVYDENAIQTNAVDLLASSSVASIAQFKSDVEAAYIQDQGGVIDGSVMDTSFTYGVHQTKTLRLNGIQFSSITASPIESPIPISGDKAFAFSSVSTNVKSFSTKFAGIDGGLNGEGVVAIGLTVLSSTGADYGTVTLTSFSPGTVSATATVNQSAGAGDTLLVIKAPPGTAFGGFFLRYTGTLGPNDKLWFDDLAFITAQVPEPSGIVLGALGVLALFAFARRRKAAA
jgi:hypothetical protein